MSKNNQTDTDSVFDEPEQDLGQVYEDPDEMHRMRTLQRIHDARERFDRGRLELQSREDVAPRRVKDLTAKLALDVVRSIEPLLRRSDSDLLQRTVSVDGAAVQIESLLDNEGRVDVVWTEEEFDASDQTYKQVEKSETKTISTSTSTRIVRLTDDFLQGVMPSGLLPDDDDDVGFGKEML